MTIEEQEKINKSPSQTFQIIVLWIVAFPIVYILSTIFPQLNVDVQNVFYGSAGCTFAYMGLEFTSEYFKNKNLPAGFGKIENLQRYKGLIYVWIAYAAIILGYTYIFKKPATDTGNQAIGFSVLLSVEYCVGMKANKTVISSKKDSSEEH